MENRPKSPIRMGEDPVFFLLALIPGFAAAQKPILIGPSLPLTGGFAETAKTIEKG